jgi:hypothetical protein
MPIPKDPKLYERARRETYAKYKTPSAYRSGALVKLYKQLGGTYADDGHEATLKRWFKEKWQDVNPFKNKNSYPVYRPTVRVNARTPLTVNEVDARDLRRQSKMKQIIRNEHNLRPFKQKKIVRRSK